MAHNYRKERIERLLQELKHEFTRGVMDGEIGEKMRFEFVIPNSKELPGGQVQCLFFCKPTVYYGPHHRPILKVVKK